MSIDKGSKEGYAHITMHTNTPQLWLSAWTGPLQISSDQLSTEEPSHPSSFALALR